MGLYEKKILPRIVNTVCASQFVTDQRVQVVPRAKGRVLEVGFGSGLNLPFYDPDKVEMVWGLEPNAKARSLAEKNIEKALFDVEMIDLPGEEIPLEANSADTILVTFTLCTI